MGPSNAKPGRPRLLYAYVVNKTLHFKSIQVVWNSAQLPPWLTWQRGVLTGIPRSDDVTAGVDLAVEALVSLNEISYVLTLL